MASRSNPVLPRPDGLTITKLQHHDDPRPHWTANVSAGGTTVHVHDLHGSWETVPNGRLSRIVLPEIAAALQGAVATEQRRQPETPAETISVKEAMLWDYRKNGARPMTEIEAAQWEQAVANNDRKAIESIKHACGGGR
jgi:hypothetical protein